METLFVVSKPETWPLRLPGVRLLSPRQYLTDERFTRLRNARVFNLSGSYRYQSLGYYVSLLAEARGHRPQPSVATIQDLKSQSLTRFYSEELDEIIGRSLTHVQPREFVLSIYFGRNIAKRYDRLARELYNLFPAPLLRAEFVREEEEGWILRSISAISAGEIPEEHRDFVVEAATSHFARRSPHRKASQNRYNIAILHDPNDPMPPSDAVSLARFVRAARRVGMEAELVEKEDFGQLAEFDGLFIRETTQVNHHTFRFARRAVAEGMVVIDDPESILKCANKVYLAELMARHHIPTPRTLVVHRKNADAVVSQLGLPCVLKQPDSTFSLGVIKVETQEEMLREIDRLLDHSDLIIAQEFMRTPFDWRIGVLDRKPLFACKYYMAPHHWQIINQEETGSRKLGRASTLAVEDVPRQVIRLAVKVAGLVGDGLYGVDIKQMGRRAYVVEVNDNPNIDSGVEDKVLRQALYDRIMELFLQRIDASREAHQPTAPNGNNTLSDLGAWRQVMPRAH